MGIFLKVFTSVVGVLSGLAIIIALFGLRMGYLDQVFTDRAVKAIELLGPPLLVLIVLVSGVCATYKIGQRVKNDYYANSYEARKDRAYKVFYGLLREGQSRVSNNPTGEQPRIEWDQKLQTALREYCISERLSVYLLNTGNRRETDAPLEDELVDYAMRFVQELLDQDFYLGRPLIK